MSVCVRVLAGGPPLSRGMMRPLAFLAVLCLSLGAHGDERVDTAAVAESAPDTLAREYVEGCAQRLRLEAEIAFYGNEANHPLEEDVFKGLGSVDAEARPIVATVLQKNEKPVAEALKRAADEVERDTESVLNEWHAVRTALNDKRMKLFEVKASKDVAGQLASLLSIDNRWFWLFGLVAIASLMVVVWHERRHEIRRLLSGGRARKMGLSYVLPVVLLLLFVATLAAFCFGNRIYLSLLKFGSGEESSPQEEMLKENEAIEQEVSDLEVEKKAAVEGYTKASENWKQRVRESLALDADLLEQWAKPHAQLERVSVALAVQAGVVGQLESDLATLAELQDEIADSAEDLAAYRRMRHWIRAALGSTLIVLAVTGWVLFLRGLRQRRTAIRDTCPLCLAQGTFEPADDGQAGAEEIGPDMVRCTNVISEEPYEECDFIFSSGYRKMVKLSFPTLGIVASGKTHWLAMAYRQLMESDFPKWIQFAPTRTPSFKELHDTLDKILNARINPAASQTYRIPHPLVFNFLDRDRLGASNVLVNIFDYSGEVVRKSLRYGQRRRALEGDGFLFFLDPTMPSEDQARALAGFRQDLYEVKGVRIGRQIHTPVALCVSKLDLMVNMPYSDYVDPRNDGGRDCHNRVLNRFYDTIKDIGWSSDLPSIEARSKLVAAMVKRIWGGWQIERQINDLFGGRFRFFPLTPVGLDELGETDLSRRVIAPVGLLDPLLWLLHMNGYRVFR